jgi:hypothetical protein
MKEGFVTWGEGSWEKFHYFFKKDRKRKEKRKERKRKGKRVELLVKNLGKKEL